MKFVDEFRDPALVRALAARLAAVASAPCVLMEVCGGQTHALLRYGLDQLLPPGVELLHGPGCPVCVTPAATLERVFALARLPQVTLCTFGDMLRVPGNRGEDLYAVRAAGADVRTVYSPLDALAIAAAAPTREVVFFAIGFETTAPAVALAVHEAARRGQENFSVLAAHVRVPPALDAILAAPDNRVQAFLAAGHVCTVMGLAEYEEFVARQRVPVVVTGFEPVDLLAGIIECVEQLGAGRAVLGNRYARAVSAAGNVTARALLEETFMPVPREWRGLGVLPASGLGLRPRYADFDAERRFAAQLDALDVGASSPSPCISGEVLRGARRPPACAAFGTLCTPDHPLGATMVSHEGACAAHYRYARAAS